MTPRLLIDATTAQHARGGIGVVTNGLLHALAAQGRDDVTVLAGPATHVPSPLHAIRPPLMHRTPARILFQRALLPLVASHLSPQRLLTLDSYVPAWSTPGLSGRIETFVHDVLPLTHPHFFVARKDAAKRLAFAAIRRSQPRVFTSTPFTASEIARELGVESQVVRFGCGQLSDDEADALLQLPPHPRKRFLLCIGAIEERKDLRTLVLGFERYRARTGSDLALAIAGNWRTDEGLAFRRWCTVNASSSVRFLGFVSSQRADELLRDAAALVYPSVAEGFGLPVLEGLASGMPVITSSIPAIASWALDAPFYFAPGDPLSLADAIAEAIAAAPAAVDRRGKELAEGYRWRSFAEAIAA